MLLGTPVLLLLLYAAIYFADYYHASNLMLLLLKSGVSILLKWTYDHGIHCLTRVPNSALLLKVEGVLLTCSS